MVSVNSVLSCWQLSLIIVESTEIGKIYGGGKTKSFYSLKSLGIELRHRFVCIVVPLRTGVFLNPYGSFYCTESSAMAVCCRQRQVGMLSTTVICTTVIWLTSKNPPIPNVGPQLPMAAANGHHKLYPLNFILYGGTSLHSPTPVWQLEPWHSFSYI